MTALTFHGIARKYSLMVTLDETSPLELWAAKLRDELAAQQGKLQETSPQNLLRFALEKQILELEEAVHFLENEIRPAEDKTTARPQMSDKIRQIQNQLAAQRIKLQESNPQSLLHFVVQRQCRELEAEIQVLSQESRRIPQQQLLTKMRQAVQDGDKKLYDSLIMGEAQSLLPAEDEVEYRNLLGIKRLAAEKRWPRDATSASSIAVIAMPHAATSSPQEP
jgi:hypothetical protein